MTIQLSKLTDFVKTNLNNIIILMIILFIIYLFYMNFTEHMDTSISKTYHFEFLNITKDIPNNILIMNSDNNNLLSYTNTSSNDDSSGNFIFSESIKNGYNIIKNKIYSKDNIENKLNRPPHISENIQDFINYDFTKYIILKKYVEIFKQKYNLQYSLLNIDTSNPKKIVYSNLDDEIVYNIP